MTKTRQKKIRFYSDPGHGWAKVRRAELEKLGIDKQISTYSYQRGEFVYLEEDGDLTTYCQALDRKGIRFEFVGTTSPYRRSKIRSYDYYTPNN